MVSNHKLVMVEGQNYRVDHCFSLHFRVLLLRLSQPLGQSSFQWGETGLYPAGLLFLWGKQAYIRREGVS